MWSIAPKYGVAIVADDLVRERVVGGGKEAGFQESNEEEAGEEEGDGISESIGAWNHHDRDHALKGALWLLLMRRT